MAPIENWYALLDAIIHKISVFKALSKRGITQAKEKKIKKNNFTGGLISTPIKDAIKEDYDG